jgi:hypothetical protein
MHMDHQSLMAAMLHDVIEDTGISKKPSPASLVIRLPISSMG